jgi:hypothetical protein
MPGWVPRLVICVAPIAITPLLALAIGEGYLNFGGGEKDLLLLIPWLLWSVLFAIVFVACWVKKLPVGKSTAYAAGIAFAVLAVSWVALFAWVGYFGPPF